MKKLLTTILTAALLATGFVTPAFAAMPMAFLAGSADVVNTTNPAYAPNEGIKCVTNATAAYTNSTTTPTDITGASCAIGSYNGDFAKDFIRVCFSADVTKATATTGSIGVYVNGALVTASKRFTSSAAGQNSISGCYTVARADGNAQTVKLQGVSGDTNLFTVAQATFEVDTIRTLR